MENRDIRKLNLKYAVQFFGGVGKLAEKADCSKKYLEQILQGFQSGKDKNPRKLGDSIASKIASALGKEPYWMDQPHPDLWGDASKDNSNFSVKEEEAEYTVNKRPNSSETDHLEIHQFETGGSMGNGLILRDQPGVIQNWRVNAEWLQKNVRGYSSAKNLCIVTGFGDSMRPLYNPGDPLLIDISITSVEFDSIYFFRIGEEGFIKRLQRVPGIGIRVLSDNEKYNAWDIKPEMDFQVFGRVIKVWKSEDF